MRILPPPAKQAGVQLQLNDGDIAYDFTETGNVKLPLLFLHGALGVRGHFNDLRRQFPDRAQLAVDFPAHGESRAAHGPMNCERLARNMVALMDALDVEQVDIVGHSMGGYVGLVMAHLAPARVRSVVTLGTKFYWDDATIGNTVGELDAATMKARAARYYNALTAIHTADGADRALAFTQALIADFARWRLDETMVRQANVPLLVCAGDRDAMVPATELMRLAQALDARITAVALIPGAAHPLQQLPVACFEQSVRRLHAFAGLLSTSDA